MVKTMVSCRFSLNQSNEYRAVSNRRGEWDRAVVATIVAPCADSMSQNNATLRRRLFSHGLAVLKRRARQAGGESHLRYRRGTIITLLCHQRWLGGKSPPSMEVLIENHGTKWGSFQPCLPEMIISRIKIDPEKCQLLADTIVWGHTQLMSWQGLWELDGGGLGSCLVVLLLSLSILFI